LAILNAFFRDFNRNNSRLKFLNKDDSKPILQNRKQFSPSVKENHKRKPEIPQNDDGADYDKDKTRERGNAEEGDMIGSPN
jgi:hypothetical protein